MIDLSTEYLGLSLKNPIIASSSGMTSNVSGIEKLEKAGAAAVVLKSIFEEEMLAEAADITKKGGGINQHLEAEDYIREYTKQNSLHAHLQLISDAKKKVAIPVIASINCASAGEWISYAKSIEEAGADALELNVFIMPDDPEQKGADIEKVYFDIARKVKSTVSIPVSMKISCYFSSLSRMIVTLSETDIDGLVLFNRFFKPDIDLDKMEIISADVFSTPDEVYIPLRWIALCSAQVKCDLLATTGIHSGASVLKAVLAGAKGAAVASILYKEGVEYIGTMLEEMRTWMSAQGHTAIKPLIGKMARGRVKDSIAYERAQFMKYFSAFKK